MLDLSSPSPTLALHARRFHDAALGAELQAGAFSHFDRRAFSRAEIAWGRAAWQQRTLDEYRSLVGLSEFLDEVGALGLPFDALATAVRVVRDEARHVELCRRMVKALGGSDQIPGEPTWVRSNRRQPLFERALTSVMGSLCVGETLSVALLAATRDVTDEPLTRAVLTCLTADESIHSRLGWTLLPLLWPQAARATKKRLTAEIGRSLRYAEQMTLDGADDGPRNPFGDLKADERRRVFTRAVKRDVLDRFAALKIGPIRA